MYLCRGSRSVLTSSLSYYNFAGSVRVATNIPPQDAVWALHNPRIISCSQVCDRGADGVHVLPLPGAVLQEKWVRSCVPGTGTACRSATGSGFIRPFSWRSKDRMTKSVFCLGTETCIIRSSTHKLVSCALCTASPQKQPNWTQREAAPDVHKGPNGGAEKPTPEQKLNKTQALKKVFKEYGAVGVSFHIGISLISLGIFYIIVSSGIDMTAVLCRLGFSETIVQSKMAAGTSTFVIAYAVHKLFAPLRISITLVSVPLIVRYLRRTGLFKASPPRL